MTNNIYNKNSAGLAITKNKTFFVALGLVITTIGFLGTLSLAARGSTSYFFVGLLGLMTICGVLLIAWCFGAD